MRTRKRIQHKIITFILLTLAISSMAYYVMISTGSAAEVGVVWMWSPGIAAVLTQLLFRDSIRNFGWGLGERKYLLWGFAMPLLYALLIYGMAWITGLAGFRGPSLSWFLLLPLGFVGNCFAALGEETSWRGLLIPELSKITTFTRAALVTWPIWAAWHYPAMVFAEYHSEAPLWFDLSTLTTAVLGMSVFTAWLRLRSRSIWPGVLWHGGHNTFILGIFLSMTTDTGITEYIVDDFGLGVWLASLILGCFFWMKRSELPSSGLQ
jgi:membrane protease YdiL (CAAX protease family)